MITIGIDPGINQKAPGGITIIAKDGSVTGLICPKEALNIYKILLPYSGVAVAAIEQVGIRHTDLMVAGKVFNIEKMLRHQQNCIAVCEILEIPVTLIAPMRWKTHHKLIGADVSDCIAKAIEEFPQAIDVIYQLSPGGRKKVPYSGIAAALLMAGWRRSQSDEAIDLLAEKKAIAVEKTKAANNAKTKARKAQNKLKL